MPNKWNRMLGSSMTTVIASCQIKVPCDSSSSSEAYLTNIKSSSKPLYPSILPLQMTKKNPTSHVLTKQNDSITRVSGTATSGEVQVIQSIVKDEKKNVNRAAFAEFILKNLTYEFMSFNKLSFYDPSYLFFNSIRK